jgi:hypothetical protein
MLERVEPVAVTKMLSCQLETGKQPSEFCIANRELFSNPHDALGKDVSCSEIRPSSHLVFVDAGNGD